RFPEVDPPDPMLDHSGEDRPLGDGFVDDVADDLLDPLLERLVFEMGYALSAVRVVTDSPHENIDCAGGAVPHLLHRRRRVERPVHDGDPDGLSGTVHRITSLWI